MYFEPIDPNDPLYKRIKHTRSADFLWEIQAQDTDGNPFDFTGSTFVIEIQEYKDDDTPVVTIPDGNFTLSASSAGQSAGVQDIVTVEHPPADFSDLIADPFEHYFDLEIEDAAGLTYVPIVGDFIIRAD